MLAGELRQLGINAYLSYFPSTSVTSIPDAYRHYGAVLGAFTDTPDSAVIVPEIYSIPALRFKSQRRFVWWLSLSNFYGWKGDSVFRDAFRSVRTLVRGRRPYGVQSLSCLTHLVQSDTVSRHLEERGVSSFPLCDFVNPVFLLPPSTLHQRQDVILFNQSKSAVPVSALQREYPHLEFRGLHGLSALDLRDVYRSSKLFVDFGPHPGRDRMPREAVSQGCALITGLRGTAANSRDVPIPSRYKLDQTSRAFLRQFGAVSSEILTNHQSIFKRDFGPFQTLTLTERESFREQLSQLTGLITGITSS
jgi:hypothetical protein